MKHNGTLEELLDTLTNTLHCMIIGHEELYLDGHKEDGYEVIAHSPSSSLLIGHKFTIIASGGAKLTIKWYMRSKTLMIQGENRPARNKLKREYNTKVVKVLIDRENGRINQLIGRSVRK